MDLTVVTFRALINAFPHRSKFYFFLTTGREHHQGTDFAGFACLSFRLVARVFGERAFNTSSHSLFAAPFHFAKGLLFLIPQ